MRAWMQGFPGAVDVSVTYTLTEANVLTVEMQGEVGAPTPLNLAQHSYFNLQGHAAGTILGHELTIHG